MSQQSKNQLLFGKTEVEDRFVNENQYDGANVPQVVTGGSHNFLDNLSDDVLKQLDEITIIANKQILEKPEWSSFSNFSGDGGGNGGGGSTTTTTTEAPTTTTTTTTPNITLAPEVIWVSYDAANTSFGLSQSSQLPNSIDLYVTDNELPGIGWSPSSGDTPTHIITNSTQMLNGYDVQPLQSSTSYYWWARANYGNGNVGPWIVGSPSKFDTQAQRRDDSRG